MKSKLYSFALVFMMLHAALAAMAQQRDKVLNITVTTSTGAQLKGQEVNVEQTDYQLNYSVAKLDANGHCTMKIYPGNHKVTVERSGFITASTTFYVADNEAGKDISLALQEQTRNPFALTANCLFDPYTAKNTVEVQWNTEKPAFFDDFESYSPFAITFGQWTGIDGDHLMTAALSGDYPNRGVFQYAQIMNPLAVDPVWYYEYPILRAFSGKQYVGFIRTQSGEANNDWLISPEITVGTDNILSFYAKAADKYNEKFIVYITTKTDNPTADDFTPLTTGNYESVDYKSWRCMQYDLAQYAQKKVKIAVRYIGEANRGGAFMLMMDDFYVGQPSYAVTAVKASRHSRAQRVSQRSVANPNENFDIYLDGKKVATTANYSYTLADVPDGQHTIGVKATYLATESDMVTTTVKVSAADYAYINAHVTANSILTADGQTLSVLSLGNGDLYTMQVKNGATDKLFLPKGRYQVTTEKGAFQAYDKTIDLQADTQLDITLQDEVMAPYNITADLTYRSNGTIQALLRWNQVLGLLDSFESYDDFATGQFGGWKTVDVDQMPVYPIGLGSADNIVSFPGSGTASAPTAIAPIVFNPWSTNPAMLPTDPAAQAPDGDKYIAFFSPQNGKADKWLISPLVDIYNGYDLKVTAKSYSSGYPETFEFAVSEGGDNPSDFTIVSTAENIPSDQWTQYSTSLDAYAGKKVRIGVHYVSYDTFFAQLDDVRVGPADGGKAVVDYGNVLYYNLYLDGEMVGRSYSSSFSFSAIPSGNHVLGIEAVYQNAVSDMATYNIGPSAIETVEADAVGTNAAGAGTEVYNLAGQKLSQSVGQLPHGVYVVKKGNIVKKIRK